MSIDTVRCLKIENPSEGGAQTDAFPTELNPSQDYMAAKGVAFESATGTIIYGNAGVMQFADSAVTSPTTLTDLSQKLKYKNVDLTNLNDGSVVTWNSTGNTFDLEANAYLGLFGDGSDGDVSISSGTVALTRTMYYQNLTLSSTASLFPNGYKIFVNGNLSIASGAQINSSGASGSIGGSNSPGIGGAASPGIDFGAGLAGANGATTDGSAGGSLVNTTGYGGPGGNGGTGGSGTNGGGSAGSYKYLPERTVRQDHTYSAGYKSGGGGGAGGGAGHTNFSGGGGGAGGGVIEIFCRTLNNNGTINANGGNGGNGCNATGGANHPGGGGGGGGGGGMIYIVALNVSSTGSILVSGGAGGQGGVPTSGGVAGTAGNNGSAGHFTIYLARTNTWIVS